MRKSFYILMGVVLLFSSIVPGGLQGADVASTALADAELQMEEESTDMPGWPMPDKPIPHHEPGHLSPANSYSTQAQMEDENGVLQTVELSGLDAMVQDGYDPLAGNYTMVDMDKLLRSSDLPDNDYGLETFALSGTVNLVPDSVNIFGTQRINDIAVGDLNIDGTAEQIAAWLDADSTINISTGEMPGSDGKSTSAPDAVAAGFGTADINLLIRGYDYALWHCLYDVSTGSCIWDSDGGGGVLLSAPAVISQSPGQFDVYAILSNNLVYRRTRNEVGWSSSWTLVDDVAYWQQLERLIPVPELPAPAVIARGGNIDLFRLGPDNSMRWRHYNGSTWEPWENLGGSFASGPAALSHSSTSMQVFARGMDDTLWTRKYNSGWGGWQRVKMDGMPESVILNSTPAAVTISAGQIDVYVRGSDNHMWTVHYNGTSWGNWSDAGGEVASAVGVALLGVEPYLFSQTIYDDLQAYPPGGPSWTTLSGLTPCCTVVDTGITGENVNVSDMHDFSIDLETGYIWGDGRSQIVMGYYSDTTHVMLALFDISDSPGDKGFTPQKITDVQVANANYFKIATGDFLDRDGVDEIAIAYINLDNDNSYTMEIYRFNRDMVNPTLEKVDSISISMSGDGNWYFSGTFDISPGDFDLDGQDEAALIMSWAKGGHDGPGSCEGNDFHFRTRFFDVDNTDPDVYTLNEYFMADDWNGWGDYDAWSQSVSLSIAAGDVDGDGQDEVVRSYPVGFNEDSHWCYGIFQADIPSSDRFVRKIQSIKLPVNEDPNENAWSSTGGLFDEDLLWFDFGTPENTEYSYEERLAAGDFNRDLQGEIYWQIAKPDATNRGVVYHYNGSGFDYIEYNGDGRRFNVAAW